MKGVLFLSLVGAAIYGAILLSYDLLPHDPAANVFTGQSLGNREDRQLRSWGTDLPALASSNSQEASLALPKAATTPVSPSPVVASTNSPSRARLGVRAISRACRKSDRHTNRNGDYLDG